MGSVIVRIAGHICNVTLTLHKLNMRLMKRHEV